ncbi:sterol regulatory element binding protein-like protein Sre1 [Plenodomus tracheiphilus IPT5]|uniref:Sterol regulatory element binding protein-like protein Sre1 n=1 Tax=Plenodomus tracheiphilus IPT5 TaxID=1408161 RepID=A0A6A7B8B7_9PLEO|nr:sterol regulatory element binding protein-like protein Sre1 [Plenodomus tracheiphilus IPT5]
MEDSMLSTEYPFANMRGPWLTTAGDDMTLTAPADEVSNWNEWMQYDPAAASQNPQGVESKPANGQGPAAAYLRPDQQPSPLLTQHQQQSQSMQAHGLPTTTAPMYANSNPLPFAFGQSADMSPAFDFTGNTLSSPLAAELQQQNGYYSPPLWQQQQQQLAESTLFSPTQYAQPGFIAPPPPASTPSLHHSPDSHNTGRASSSSSHSSPEPVAHNKKRKSPSDDDEDADSAPSGKRGGQPPKKTAHNMIEKRYRNNLNDKIAALRDSVPSLRIMSRPNGTEEDDDPEDLEGLTPAHKLNKATVLSKATEYIRHLEKRNKRMQDELTALKGRVESYEKMAISGPMAVHGLGTPDGSRYHDDPFTPTHGMPMPGPPQGMIPVPENIAALQRGLGPQQHYAHAYPQYAGGRQATGPPMVNARHRGAMMGKLMVGSLAGLMILEGFAGQEQSQEEPAGRGLFALPIHLAKVLTPRASFGASSVEIPLVKLLLILFAFFWLAVPLVDFKPKPRRKSPPVLLTPAPSLASPVEVRQKAWLTAIQTVWVPQHNFILELAALGLKTMKLSLRKLIGWPGYAYLTGITKDQEAARVKAWEIALDAQLTGGDAEISKSRLVLTLMASGTLPDTPARLMLKALHIRVLLWEVTNSGQGSWWMMDDLSAKMARSYWNMARSEHRIASNMTPKPDSETAPLPDHLAALIERDCDEVLVPAVVERLYNLAWNRPSSDKKPVDTAMDGVVEDFAIASPLDALAAWFSSTVLKKALSGALANTTNSPKESMVTNLELALRSAPPNSQAQLRSLVAQAVVLEEDRGIRIAKALDALPTSPKPAEAGFINLVGNGFVAPDVRQALTLAKCLFLAQSANAQGHQRAIDVVNKTYLPQRYTTLLSFVAGYKVLTHFMQDATLQNQTSVGLERIAKSLRIWIGHDAGKKSGPSNKVLSRLIQTCLEASKTLVGLGDKKDEADVDDGYVSASVKDD